MKSLVEFLLGKFFVTSFFIISLILNSTFAQDTKIQMKLTESSAKSCDSTTVERLKGEITEYMSTIFCARAGDVTDFEFCAGKLISGAAFSVIGKVHEIDAKHQLQRFSERSKTIAELEVSNKASVKELAASKQLRAKVVEGINGTDKQLEALIRVNHADPAKVKEELIDKKQIYERQIGDYEKQISHNTSRIDELKNMSLDKITSDLKAAKMYRAYGGAAALTPMKLNWLTFLEIGPDCNLRGLLTELGDDCRPVPVFGNREMELLYSKRLVELAKNIPQVCAHFENIKNVMALQVEALKKMYNEGISYSRPKCEPGKISYNVNGNGYVRNGEVTLMLDKDGKIKNTFIKTENLKYSLDYLATGRQEVNSLIWESSDPGFPGQRKATRKEIPSAMKQEVVERGMSFHVLNRTAGEAAIACCAEDGKNCEGFLPVPTQKRETSEGQNPALR